MRDLSIFIRAMATALLIATSAPSARAQQAPLQDKPFAEHKIVLQLSDDDPRKQALVLSVASNLMKHYDPDKVAIEIVAFGPGIEPLRPPRVPSRCRCRTSRLPSTRSCCSFPTTTRAGRGW